ncbi:MAG: type II toxin-antitoxin system VapC family toxin [Alphaproteobacteria bacterium]|nr:type II toxin-antitoxin system VapC family toxin [Alphaproteobacteria bacterium]
MILLDTNVVSETMRATPAPAVIAWLDEQATETLYLSTVSLAELLLGIALLPNGRRKRTLGDALTQRAITLFADRILAFDLAAAEAYPGVVTRAQAAGRVMSVADGQIASIAAAHRMSVATRDLAPFTAAGIRVIDPWNATNA